MTAPEPKSPNGIYFYLSLLLVASVLVALPVFIFGIPNGNDFPQHFRFALAFFESVQNGTFYPGWYAAANFGFGDVGVRFYPPFSYYVLGLFRWMSGDWYNAISVTICFWFLTSGIGAYLLCREWFDENASLVAAIVYLLMPYHVNQIYNAFFYAEFAASAILPFCFLFATRICRDGQLRDVVGLAVFYSLLILTNLPMAVIGSISLLVFALASLRMTNFSRSVPALCLAVFLGLLASGFYWVRMIAELNMVKLGGTEFFSNAYDFHSNFLLSFFYVSRSVYVDRSLWFSDLLLLVTFAIFAPSALLYHRSRRRENKFSLTNVIILLVFALIIATPLSLPIWEAFSPLQKIQFPWRWLAVISLMGSVFVAAGHRPILDLYRTKARPIALAASGLILAGLVFTLCQIIRPAVYAPRADFNQEIENLDNTESCECLWPREAKKEAFTNKEKVSVSNRALEVEFWRPTDRAFNISAGPEQDARMGTFSYLHWKARVNEVPVETKVAGDGTILIPLPTGASRVNLRFEEPLYARASLYLSIAAWAFFALLLLLSRFYKVRSRKTIANR